MKQNILLLAAILFSQISFSQCTNLVFQPDAAGGMDAEILNINPNNDGNQVDLVSAAWTSGGNPIEDRALLQFDLSVIPSSATIVTARLSLYADTASIWGSVGQPTSGNNNASHLKRITSVWTEMGVTWNTQPNSDTAGQILLAQSTSTKQDYTNIDVTAFVQDWVTNPTSNYGMLLDMITTTQYNSMIFCSSDHPNAAKHPKLEVCYINLENPCVTLQPDAADGMDAEILDINPNNDGNQVNLVCAAWTSGGNPIEDRGLLRFSLSSIPSGATVTSAKLSLYADTASIWGAPGQPTSGNNNASYLKRVTSAWTEMGVTWNTQPTSDTTGQILLAQSVSTKQDYTDINVAAFAQMWIDNPSQNFGMLLDMITTTQYNSMIFCSSDHPNAAKHPKLEVCYTEATGVSEKSKDVMNVLLFPNPANDKLFIETNGLDVTQINIYNTNGSLVGQTKQLQNKSIDISELANGIYIAEIISKEASTRKKFVKM